MDMVWMTQNFHAVIKFCFGPKAHSMVFLCEWADHMYENRNMYMTQHASDPYFFAKVLYAINHALQKHWRSCSMSDDRLSVNDNVLRMHEVQDSILSFVFTRKIPKSISDKIDNHLESLLTMMIKEKTANKMAGAMVVGIIMMAKKIKTCCTILINQTPHGASKKVKTSQKFSIKSRRSVPRLGMES
jgi:hypothetical protein